MPSAGDVRSPTEAVRAQYIASATGDLELWRSVVAEDVEWTEAAGFPLAGTYRTPGGIIDGVFTPLAQEWDDWTTHDDTYVTDGERVVVLARYTARNKTTGKTMEARVAHSFIVRSGRIVRMEQIVDSASVRDAMV
ncbi:nuclear transport factor 2 family protein [Streptomyces sp. NPDC051920]|uniref:nuclear transport factor 2 family protein n=1 Tax=Streptomyces sp. NPDC051920 TaxID=3155523 RepID=UPI003442FA9E